MKRHLNPTIPKKISLFITLLAIALAAFGCTPNDPYRAEDTGKNIYYSTFNEPPTHLDPARAYSSNEYRLLAQIYEPPVQYHYLKRPYELVPLSAAKMPEPAYYDKDGRRLAQDAPPEKVHRAVYEIKIKKGILYQNHPAFAKDEKGRPLYLGIRGDALKEINTIEDFPEKGTKELTSDDYIYQIKRLADPGLQCPILPILNKYILGLDDFSKGLAEDLKNIRAARRARQGAAYNQVTDEKENPIVLDYRRQPLAGVEKIDDHRFRVTLKRKYPQFIYWLAMPFFSPVPKEAAIFYSQGPLKKKNITIDRFPVGTGAFRMDNFEPQREITLVRNENFRGEPYPSEGEPGDRAAGLLEDAGKALPFIERAVYKLEKEAIPRWNKFLQGYFDLSGITSDSFDQAVTINVGGGANLNDKLAEKDIKLITSVQPTIYYTGFNMLDDVVGGYTPEQQKLRQAISIIINYEEFIEIFANGRGVAAMGPIPEGIFGKAEGKGGMNPVTHRWDAEKNRAVRRPVEEAKKLLAEAGYPGGRDKDGRPLTITFDNAWTGASSTPMINWYIKRFKLIGIQLENRTTDYNRFQEKINKGNFQFFFLGWNADYPDPENFFFLLAGENAKVKTGGANASNYENPEFDRLFKIMENMDSTPKRLEIIARMTRILQEDAPWVWGYSPLSFSLAQGWVGNIKPNAMANNTLKYMKIDTEKRTEMRTQWNAPVLWPIALLIAVLAAASVPAIILIRKKYNNGGRG
ncbi:ABC transporter, substrate-binding protein (cluster 5, nickel/peptides/opines) [hydrothermal vent metagenome]|uniref:ABC transporter, substrate-binding protein (Cluster 5, nickel/peptides/opines) n=1 Tax=hydrothermal vent metagenome TaxID=652676 RepID=A0A3B0UYU3_9ZZZZ